jgi:general secretion pathway protein G
MAMKSTDKTNREGGFTLVELLVVLVILALLAALVGPRVIGYMSQSKIKTAKVQIASYQSALELYHLDMGHYPPAQAGLQDLVTQPSGSTGWAGPYLDKAVAPDPWGNAYVYTADGTGAAYVLKSLGADGKEGGDGDNADISP